MNNVKRMKWCGWGEEGKVYDISRRNNILPYLEEKLAWKKSESTVIPPVVSKVEIPVCDFSPELLDKISKAAAPGKLDSSDESRIRHAFGRSYRDMVRLRSGKLTSCPDAVVYPVSEEGVARILKLAGQLHFNVIPYGAGSGVVGGTESMNGGKQSISMDMSELNFVLSINEESRLAKVQAGIFGPDLEEHLNGRGFTLGHFPQSFEFSTLGGWVCTRSAGQASTKYGKIEEMVHSLRMITPSGVIETKAVPATAAGPGLKDLVIGSEGRFGVLVEAVMRIRMMPEKKRGAAFVFNSFTDGAKAIKRMIQSEIRPAVVRLSDPDETEAFFNMMPEPSSFLSGLKTDLGKKYIALRGGRIPGASLLMMMYEGGEDEVAWKAGEGISICRRENGIHLGPTPVRKWEGERFELPYFRDNLLDWGLMVDTLETAASWDNLLNVYEKVRNGIKSGLDGRCIVMTHISHAYRDGASLYFTFLAPVNPGSEISVWTRVKKSASDAIAECGATISHHHGVGYEHIAWMNSEIGQHGMDLLKALGKACDPDGVMNPGKVWT